MAIDVFSMCSLLKKTLTNSKFVIRDSFAPGIMVWTGVSYYGKTLLIFIDKCVNQTNTNEKNNKLNVLQFSTVLTVCISAYSH